MFVLISKFVNFLIWFYNISDFIVILLILASYYVVDPISQAILNFAYFVTMVLILLAMIVITVWRRK
ncbi:MAG: hypothetical protein ACP6IU_13125 [Candidatus Asgardarchaeia archaeon]